ncbi:hypothetical protein LCGC14_2831120 [marine sediment metagenome]|uniref:Uncharacterized protein n=1 Tax=marine sediment metagenome TaxID=412755 RepID=A0A0F9AMH4_9ZZZZ
MQGQQVPTYKFRCECNKEWTERQALSLDGSEHVSKCPKCGKECQNIALGGTGFQFAGRSMNKQLRDFPDYTDKVNRDAMKDADQMEKIHDARQREDSKKEKEE